MHARVVPDSAPDCDPQLWEEYSTDQSGSLLIMFTYPAITLLAADRKYFHEWTHRACLHPGEWSCINLYHTIVKSMRLIQFIKIHSGWFLHLPSFLLSFLPCKHPAIERYL